MQNEICVVKSFFHHVLVCEKKEVPLSTLTFGYTNAIPQVLSEHTFKVDRYVEYLLKIFSNLLETYYYPLSKSFQILHFKYI